MPTIPELEQRIADARNDRDRLEAMLSLAWELINRDTRHARELAEESCSIARNVLSEAERRRRTSTLVSASIIDACSMLARALHILGRCHRLLSDFPAAKTSLDESLSLYERIVDRTGASHILIELGSVNADSDDFPSALRYFTEALDVKNEIGDKRGAAVALGNIGRVYQISGDYAQAIRSYQRCSKIFTELNDVNGRATSHFNVGIVYHLSGNYTPALEEYNQSLSLFEENNDHAGIAHALNNIGSLYVDLHDDRHAIELFLRSLELKESIGDVRGCAVTLNNLGDIEHRLGNYSEALDFFARSMELTERIGDKRVRAGALRGIAETYLAMENIPAAATSIESSLQIYEAVGAAAEIARSLLVSGLAYAHAGQFDSAVAAVTKALDIAGSIDSKPLLADVHGRSSEVYKLMGEHEKALHHHELFHTLDKDIFNFESDKRSRTLMASLDLERAEKDASILRMSNEQLEQEIDFKKRELTTTAMHLTEKNEFLHKLRGRIRDLDTARDLKRELDSILNDIDEAVDSHRYWESFEQQFQQVHTDFLGVLAERFPALTPTELKVCALLKINLSSKDIARVLNTETRTIERYRQRVRKKLGLAQQENLGTFLAAV